MEKYSINGVSLLKNKKAVFPMMGEFFQMPGTGMGRRNQENESLWHGYHSNLCFLDSS